MRAEREERAIREASVADLDSLMRLDRACFSGAPWPREVWIGELGSGSQSDLVSPLVLLLGGPEPVAFVCAPILAFDERCEVRRIAVAPRCRGRGLAGDLLLGVIARAHAAGCTRVELEVAEDNLAALAAYRRADFSVVGRRPGYYRSPLRDALLLDRVLPSKPAKSRL